MNVDGWLTIGTRIDNKKLQSDLKKQKQELEKYGKEAEELLSLKEKYEADIQAYDDEQKHLQEVKKEYDEINKRVREIAKERSRISDLTESEMKQAYAENPELSTGYFELLNKRSALNKEIIKGTTINNEEIEKEKQALADINQRLDENLSKQHAIGQDIDKITTQLERGQINNSIQSIGNNITKIIRKVSRWALAVFGLRSAYMAVRNAINVISQGDEQLKADIDYIKSVFAYALEPVVRKIVDLAKTLLYYIGYIIRMWTGYDIFENANKNLKKSVGSAKELKKQLAGFDEMNVLSDSSSGGGASANAMNLDKFVSPKWLQLVTKYGKKLMPIIASIVAGLTKIKSLGIGVAIYGVYTTIKNLVDFINGPNFKSFVNVLEGIAITVLGIGGAIANWPVILAGALGLIVVEIVKNFDDIMKKFSEFNDWLDKNVLKWLEEHFGKVGDFIYLPIKTAVELAENLFGDLFGGIKKIVEGIVKIFKGDFKGGITDIFGGLYLILIKPFKDFYNGAKNMILELLDLLGLYDRKKKSVGGGGTGSFSGGGSMGSRAKGGIFYPSKLPRLAVGGIINQPGSGVGYHGAYIGERGAEAVVPLTDSQQMALLGETIGRYVNIKADIPVYVGNRMVARELKRINAEDDFAYNR